MIRSCFFFLSLHNSYSSYRAVTLQIIRFYRVIEISLRHRLTVKKLSYSIESSLSSVLLNMSEVTTHLNTSFILPLTDAYVRIDLQTRVIRTTMRITLANIDLKSKTTIITLSFSTLTCMYSPLHSADQARDCSSERHVGECRLSLTQQHLMVRIYFLFFFSG